MGQYHDLDDDDITGGCVPENYNAVNPGTRKISLEFRHKNGENGI